MTRVGLIGVGEIGSHFARRLMDDGFGLVAYDVDPDRCIGAVSAIDAATASDVILLSLRTAEQVAGVMEQILPVLRDGQVVVDTGTTRFTDDPGWAARWPAFIDAPVTWRGDRLLMLAGGDIEPVRDVLECVSSRLVHIGLLGSGHRLKLVNQLILLCQMAVRAEAVELARALGLDPKLIPEALELDVPEAMFGHEFAGPMHVELGFKDLGYILEGAREAGARVPLASFVHHVFEHTNAEDGARVQPAIVTYWRDRS